MEQTFILFFVLGAVALVAALIWAWEKKRGRKVDQSWAQVAEALNGTFQRQSGPWYKRKAREIEAAGPRGKFLIDHYLVSTGQSSQVYTRLQQAAIGSAGLSLKVYRKHFFSDMASSLGFQDVATGDPDFDKEYVVKTNDRTKAKVWLDADVRQSLLAVQDYRFELKDGELKAVHTGLDVDVARLVAAAKTLSLFAEAGLRMRDWWKRFAEDHSGHMPDEVDNDVELKHRGVPLRIETNQESIGLSSKESQTRIRARILDPEGERFVVSRVDRKQAKDMMKVEALELGAAGSIHSSNPEKTARRLPPEMCQRIAELDLSLIEADDEYLTLTWSGLQPDEARVLEAIEVAADLAQSTTKVPYR